MPVLLIIAISALIAGPFLAQILRQNRSINQVLDGFVLVSVAGLATLHLLPEAILEIHWSALLMLMIGALLPSLIERRFHKMEQQTHVGVILLVLVGILVHTTLDGLALSSMSIAHGAGQALAVAVVLHRLPIGILVWWSARAVYGKRGGIITLSIMATFTLIGYWLGGGKITILSTPSISYVQALITGSLLHVIIHKPYYRERFNETEPASQAWHPWSATGAVLGFALLFLMPREADSEFQVLMERFFITAKGLFIQSSPALLLGFTIAAVLGVFIPRATFEWISHSGRARRISRGILFGLPLPVCSRGVAPLYHTLVKRGAPLGAAIAFLIAAPELGLDAILISYPLLGGALLAVRLGAAVVIAFGVAWILDKLFFNHPLIAIREIPAPDAELLPAADLRQRGQQVWYLLNWKLVDELGPWLVFGFLLAAAAEPLLRMVAWTTIPGWLAVLSMTLVGLPIYVCASGATPLGAVMLANGIAPGAVLAFLLAGSASSVTTLGILKKLHGSRVMWVFLFTITGLTWIIGMVVNGLIPLDLLPGNSVMERETFSWLQWGSAIILLGLLAGSLFRIGPRRMVQTVLNGNAAPAEKE